MTNVREFIESPMVMGENEIVAFTVTVPTTWGSSPANPAAKIFDDVPTDVTATKMSGDASVVGSVITLPLITSLVSGTRYRVEVQWTDSGNTLEAFGWVDCED